MIPASVVRLGFLGALGGIALGAAITLATGSLVACATLSETSPLPSADASDLDAGFVPVLEDASTAPPTQVDAGPPPPSARVRLANLIQDGPQVDLCTRSDLPGSQWEGQKITSNPFGSKPDGLAYGEVSTHIFLSVPTPPPPPAQQGTRYQFRIVPVGGPCEGDAGTPLVSIPAGANTQLTQGGGLTIAVVGIATAEVGTEASPKGLVVADLLNPPAAFANLRVVHGVSDLAAFDVLVNADTAIPGVKYATALGFPYDKPNGFVGLAGGIPDNATITLKSGTTVRTFKAGPRIRRGVAVTLFASGRLGGPGTSPGIVLSLCADRSPPETSPLAACTKLQEVK